MPAMKVTDFLLLQGWEPLDREMMIWRHEGEPDHVSFFWAAHKEGIVVPHCWNEHFSCIHCGTTQYRVLLNGESAVCYGVPDVKAFEDAANFDKLTDRIKRALEGEEGMLWDNKND